MITGALRMDENAEEKNNQTLEEIHKLKALESETMNLVANN